MDEEIRQVLADEGRLGVPIDQLGDEDDLYRAGLSSHASVGVMLGLEDRFEVEFPEPLLRRDTFRSVASIRQALVSLLAAADPG